MPTPARMTDRIAKAGLTSLEWMKSTDDIMIETLAFIRREFGSIDGFLAASGTYIPLVPSPSTHASSPLLVSSAPHD